MDLGVFGVLEFGVLEFWEFWIFGFWDLSLSLSCYSTRMLHPKMSQDRTDKKAGFALVVLQRFEGVCMS